MVRKYRGEIQALRTIAVLAVVVYHINPDWLPGGFIGVDVFFVISGYLITAGLLRRVAEHGRISAADFWANRARRILPAATLTIITVTLASLFILPRSQFPTLSLQAVASGFYVQNYALARQSVDYLAADSAPTPFQHFWSLSIEEQFYIFWPMLVVAAWHIAQRIRWASPTDDIRHRRVKMIATVLFFAVVGGSFAYSVYITAHNPTNAYFYTLSRVWELGVGGLLAVYLGDPVRFPRTRKWLALAGTLTIIACAFVYSGDIPFPGLTALVPVAATAAVITAGHTTGWGSPQRIFELWPVQRIGDWSYSMYLWHFPIIVFFEALAGRKATVLEAVIIVLASILIAGFSFYLFEKPILHSPTMRRSSPLTLAGAVIVVTAAVGIGTVPHALVKMDEAKAAAAEAQVFAPPELNTAGEFGPGFRSLRTTMYEPRYQNQPLKPGLGSIGENYPTFAGCGDVPAPGTSSDIPPCVTGDKNGTKTLVLAGDSHAVQWVPAFEQALGRDGWKIVVVARENCPLNPEPRSFEQQRQGFVCSRAVPDMLGSIEQQKPDAVFITNRRYDDFAGGQSAAQRGYDAVFKQLTDKLNGAKIIALGDSPEVPDGENMADCVAAAGDDTSTCDFPRPGPAEEKSNKPLRAAAEAAGDGVDYADTLDAFCTERTCPAVIGSRVVYRDSNHITVEYSKTLGSYITRDIVPLITPAE